MSTPYMTKHTFTLRYAEERKECPGARRFLFNVTVISECVAALHGFILFLPSVFVSGLIIEFKFPSLPREPR